MLYHSSLVCGSLLSSNKTTRNIVNASYLFTQFSTLAKIYTTTAREPSIYVTDLPYETSVLILFQVLSTTDQHWLQKCLKETTKVKGKSTPFFRSFPVWTSAFPVTRFFGAFPAVTRLLLFGRFDSFIKKWSSIVNKLLSKIWPFGYQLSFYIRRPRKLG